MQSEFNPKGPQANFDLQNPTAASQPSAANRNVPITQNFQAQSRTADIHVDDVNSVVDLYVKDQKEVVRPDVRSAKKSDSAPPLGVVLSFKGTMSTVDYELAAPSVSKYQPWSGGIPVMQFMQNPKHDHEPCSLLENYSRLPLTNQVRHPVTSQLQTPLPTILISCNPEDETDLTQIKPVFTNYKSRNNKAITSVACTIDSVSVQVERGIVNSQDFGAKHETNGLASWIPSSREPSMKNETDLISISEDFPLCALQNIDCFDNVGLNNMEIFHYNDSTSLTELYTNWYDGLEFNWEYLYDPVEYPIIDDCLFA